MKKIVTVSLLTISLCACSNSTEVEEKAPEYHFRKNAVYYVGMDEYIPFSERGFGYQDQLDQCGYEYELGEDLVLYLDDDEKEELFNNNKKLIEEASTYYQKEVNPSFEVSINDDYQDIIFSLDSMKFLSLEEIQGINEFNAYSKLGEAGIIYDILNLCDMNNMMTSDPYGYMTVEMINAKNGNHVVECFYPATSFSITDKDWEVSDTIDHRSTQDMDTANELKGTFVKIEDDCFYFTVDESDIYEVDSTLYFDTEEAYIPYTYENMKVTIKHLGEGYSLTSDNFVDGKVVIDTSKPQKITDIIYFYGERES